MEREKHITTLEAVVIVLIIFIVVAGCVCSMILRPAGSAAPGKSADGTAVSGDPLSYWTDGCEPKEQLTSYMKAITDEASPDFIPVEDRIAVFDLDGTLFGETNPIYFDHTLLIYRVLQDPTYVDKASDFEKETCYTLIEGIKAGTYPSGMDQMHGQAIASAFSGMTVDEFVDYCIAFREQEAPGYDGLKRGDLFYLPMLQIIDYLQANDFTVYVVSGTDRLILRGIVKDKLNIPFSQVKGSDETIIATGQGEEDGLKYDFTASDSLVLGGTFVTKNLKMNKVAIIAQEIGQQPVLSFGNSSGDYSMSEYVTENNPYKSLAFMLCCDDLDREYGNEKKAQTMLDHCREYGHIPVSMKNDWTTIYGDNAKKNPDKGLSFYYDYPTP